MRTIALAGNPNVGKSTVFNALTGLNQHTGNWPGKTVASAEGTYTYHNQPYRLVDLPGTYSLFANSMEEEVARDFLLFDAPDATVVVADATCLERNLNLVLQVLELTPRVVVCVNLLDEAKKKCIHINLDALSHILGVPVIGTSARDGSGLSALLTAIEAVASGAWRVPVVQVRYDDALEAAIAALLPTLSAQFGNRLNPSWTARFLLDPDPALLPKLRERFGLDPEEIPALAEARVLAGEQLRDRLVSALVETAEALFVHCVFFDRVNCHQRDRALDRILTSKRTGIPIMIALLGLILWLTISGANYPSALLSQFFAWLETPLSHGLSALHLPSSVVEALVTGMFRTLGWVVAVMLPPMAIFFPLFTLLEDAGYLPRVAFNLDRQFRRACAHGKQALTMCMGLGCNACGVIGCRIIDSPRERMIAILTNNFIPCNGRFPTLIAILTIFFAGGLAAPFGSLGAALLLTAVILFSILMTLLVSRFLSKTLLRGLPSSFALELPPYRRPQIGTVLVRSLLDRTLFVLGRAVRVAAPAGLILWILANITVGDLSLLAHCTTFLDPFARLIGLDGVILMAFLLGFPANEIVLPIVMMCYLSTGSLAEYESLASLHTLLLDHGWTWLTALCTMLFSLLHFPCATTCQTIYQETRSIRWTLLAIGLPTAIGLIICFLLTTFARIFHLVP